MRMFREFKPKTLDMKFEGKTIKIPLPTSIIGYFSVSLANSHRDLNVPSN